MKAWIWTFCISCALCATACYTLADEQQTWDAESLRSELQTDKKYHEFIAVQRDIRALIASPDLQLSVLRKKMQQTGWGDPCTEDRASTIAQSRMFTNAEKQYLSVFCKRIALTEYIYSTYPGLRSLSREDRIDILYKPELLRVPMIHPRDIQESSP